MQHKAILGLVVLTVVGVALWGVVNNTQAYATNESQVYTVTGAAGLTGKRQSAAALTVKSDFLPAPVRSAITIGSAGGPQTLSVLSLPVSLDGSISSMGVDGLIIDTTQGQVSITGGEWMYVLRQGFSAAPGDVLQLEGFYEKGEFLVSLIRQMNDASPFLLRDATGQLVRGVGR
jgi:hypothetical protein